MGDERPTLDDWLGGRVPKKTRAERKLDHEQRTQVRQNRVVARMHYSLRRYDLYRRIFGAPGD